MILYYYIVHIIPPPLVCSAAHRRTYERYRHPSRFIYICVCVSTYIAILFINATHTHTHLIVNIFKHYNVGTYMRSARVYIEEELTLLLWVKQILRITHRTPFNARYNNNNNNNTHDVVYKHVHGALLFCSSCFIFEMLSCRKNDVYLLNIPTYTYRDWYTIIILYRHIYGYGC